MDSVTFVAEDNGGNSTVVNISWSWNASGDIKVSLGLHNDEVADTAIITDGASHVLDSEGHHNGSITVSRPRGTKELRLHKVDHVSGGVIGGHHNFGDEGVVLVSW